MDSKVRWNTIVGSCLYETRDERGRDAGTVVPQLRAADELREVYKNLQHQILYAWQVPPQVLGQNINSERLASSNTLTERALRHYDTHLKAIRAEVRRDWCRCFSLSECCDVCHVCSRCKKRYTCYQPRKTVRTSSCIRA